MRVVSNGAIEQAITDSEGMRFSASLRLLASAEVGRRHANAWAGEEPGAVCRP